MIETSDSSDPLQGTKECPIKDSVADVSSEARKIKATTAWAVQQQTRFVVRAIYGNDNKAQRVVRFLRALFGKLSISRKFRVASIDMQQITGITTPGLFALTINKCMPAQSGAGNARQRNLVAFSFSRWMNHLNSRLSRTTRTSSSAS